MTTEEFIINVIYILESKEREKRKMKLSELLKENDVELTEEQEKKLKEFLGLKKKKMWIPKKGETFFVISDGGVVFETINSEIALDFSRINYFNCFKSEAEAKFRAEQIKVYNELKNFAEENNDEIIDWNDNFQKKFYIIGVINNAKIDLDYSTVYSTKNIGQIYFSSEELIKDAIEKVGEDRIKKYLFGVE